MSVDLIKENGFILKKRKKQMKSHSMDADYTDDQEFLANTFAELKISAALSGPVSKKY